MAIYIKGMGNISPQQSWNDETLLIHAFDYRGVLLRCVEPDYETWIDPRQSRRMSRILKMGITSALMALKQSGVQAPTGIITGTGLGCLEDTGIFLTKLVENKEEALNPTPFIQSTHNTIGSTIAMLLQCQGYNQTFTHNALSFESALLDAQMVLSESPEQRLLVGGVDEITELSHSIFQRFGVFRRRLASTLSLFRQPKPGTVNGEGAAFFFVTGIKDNRCIASVDGIRTFYKPDSKKLHDGIEVFIREAGLTPADVDLVLLGKSGDKEADGLLDATCRNTFTKSSIGLYKHLCGEHPAATAFALWLGARILQEHHIPEVVIHKQVSRPLRNVLIFNGSFGTHFSLILLKECRGTI
jgi:3-oxoacyl-[acyl-carrier-protein] synthase II